MVTPDTIIVLDTSHLTDDPAWHGAIVVVLVDVESAAARVMLQWPGAGFGEFDRYEVECLTRPSGIGGAYV